MDNYGSHNTKEFAKLANDNHIRPYPLPPHMTNCMQPLDVRCFQAYKHWHDVAINEILARLEYEYRLRPFLRDLPRVRDNTFKNKTIRHAFVATGMYPVSCDQALKNLKVFSPPELPLSPSQQKQPKDPKLPAHCQVTPPTNL